MSAQIDRVRAIDLIHGDAEAGRGGHEVAPSITVSTTFRQPDPALDSYTYAGDDRRNPERYVYSREAQQNLTRVEHVLSKINQGFALTYSSGLAASHAALLLYVPKRVAVRAGYHGFLYGVLELYKRVKGESMQIIDLDDEYQPGDLCWLETPVNPTGEARDIQYYADKIHKVGGKLVVDSTFAPPPLQYPFNFGADCIMHSATKYFGGHSDLLAGVLIVPGREDWDKLHDDRVYLGSTMGSLEAWLLLRSLRTYQLRILRQSSTATQLVKWLSENVLNGSEGVPAGVIQQVWHSSIQKDPKGFEPAKQMTGGFNPTFSILLSTIDQAAQLPHRLNYFVAATSLGGVESLAEHRKNSDAHADPRIVRLSIGVEDFEDLRDDLKQALIEVSKLVPNA